MFGNIFELQKYLDNLTQEQRVIISKVKRGNLGIFVHEFTEDEKWQMSTGEGIDDQRKKFEMPQGFVYYFNFNGHSCTLQKMCAHKLV